MASTGAKYATAIQSKGFIDFPLGGTISPFLFNKSVTKVAFVF